MATEQISASDLEPVEHARGRGAENHALGRRRLILVLLASVAVTMMATEPLSGLERTARPAGELVAQESPDEGGGEEAPEATLPSEDEAPEDEAEPVASESSFELWQWALALALVVGAVMVISRSKPEAEPPSTARGDARSLLERYFQAAAAIAASPDSREELTYQIGVLGGLSSRLDAIILHSKDPDEKAALVAVHEAVAALENQLRAAGPAPGQVASPSIRSSAAAVEQQVQRALEFV